MTVTGDSDDAPRRVLVVEDRAHRPIGHFPTRFAEVAQGLAENGCVVEVLTSQGWLHDGERPVPFVVNRYGRVDRLLYRVGESWERTRVLHRFSSALRTVGLTRAARSWCRQAGDPIPDVIIVSKTIDPLLGSARSERGHWLFFEFGAPWRAVRDRSSKGAAHGRVRIATPSADVTAAWAEIAPLFNPVTIPIAGVRPRARVPDARLRLGLRSHDRVALVFGVGHKDKDIDLVARVFAELPEWQVVVAGQVADNYRQRTSGREAIIIGGHVDNATRDVTYSAADLVVLSFTSHYQRNSGVLTDAISFGVPVVCSDNSVAADLVREYKLGVVFEPGNPDSLERAIRNAPAQIDAVHLERARTELSNRAVAARFLKHSAGPPTSS